MAGGTRGGYVIHLHKGQNKVQAKSVSRMVLLRKVQCSRHKVVSYCLLGSPIRLAFGRQPPMLY